MMMIIIVVMRTCRLFILNIAVVIVEVPQKLINFVFHVDLFKNSILTGYFWIKRKCRPLKHRSDGHLTRLLAVMNMIFN